VSTYSERWRTRFGRPDPGRTDADIAFLTRTLPLPDFRRVLEQLYHPEELELLGAAHGLVPVLRIAPDDASAMQLVLQHDA